MCLYCQGIVEVVYFWCGDVIVVVKKYNDVQFDGKFMKIEIVGNNNFQFVFVLFGRYGNGNFNGVLRR